MGDLIAKQSMHPSCGKCNTEHYAIAVTELLAQKTLPCRTRLPLLLGFHLAMANCTFTLLKTLLYMKADQI